MGINNIVKIRYPQTSKGILRKRFVSCGELINFISLKLKRLVGFPIEIKGLNINHQKLKAKAVIFVISEKEFLLKKLISQFNGFREMGRVNINIIIKLAIVDNINLILSLF
jgi:hypothetical protein